MRDKTILRGSDNIMSIEDRVVSGRLAAADIDELRLNDAVRILSQSSDKFDILIRAYYTGYLKGRRAESGRMIKASRKRTTPLT